MTMSAEMTKTSWKANALAWAWTCPAIWASAAPVAAPGVRPRASNRATAPLYRAATAGWKRQDSERKRAVARVSLRWPLPAGAYAACSTAHTSPHRSWNRRR